MQLQILGAAKTVTGSMHLLTINGHKILLECGFWQGRRREMEEVNRNFPFAPSEIEALILSHAHIDHSGNIPNLVKQGFRGKIYCTTATAALLELMLMDSARIQVYDIDYLNRKKVDGVSNKEPLYSPEDIPAVTAQTVGLSYHEWFSIIPGVRAYFQDAGHVLGSALVTLEIEEAGQKKLLGFTGDLGRKGLPILRDPEQLDKLDYLISEGTYGDRGHDDFQSSYIDLAKIINETYAAGGKIIIPSFALERAQELLYIIHELINIKAIPPLFVYVDSPLTVQISEIFADYPSLMDKETKETFYSQNKDPFIFTTLRFVESAADSKKLNNIKEPCIIISASGMCEFGRIRHHLKNSLGERKNTIIIVGFMAENTLGRKLLEGVKEVNILNAHLQVRARIEVMNSLSAHADQTELINFIKGTGKLKKIFLVHGEVKALTALAAKVKSAEIGEIMIAEKGEKYVL